MFSLDKLLKGDNLKYVLGAVALGVGGAYLLSKQNASSNYTIPSNLVQGQVNTYYPSGANRSFTNLSNEARWNSLPLPDVEIAVPFDTFDRFATVQGGYGEDYSYIGTPS
jgi:hypothetical protein